MCNYNNIPHPLWDFVNLSLEYDIMASVASGDLSPCLTTYVYMLITYLEGLSNDL